MAKKGREQKRSSWGKKQWFKVMAPDIFDKDKELVETPAFKSDQLMGRIVELPMTELTKSFKHYKYKVFLKIVDVKGEKANTVYWGHELLRDVISRMVRKRTSRIDLIEDVTTKDGVKVRVKLLLITRGRIQTTLKSRIRKEMKAYLEEQISKMTLKEFLDSFLSETFQRGLAERVKSLHPTAYVDVRKTEVLE
ncbi:MAG: 30S ribosomal protein S3ae [Candidatus Nanohaloarchaeota archaeon]|nr:30S ribosomal protein S3ae [Candidatus Nanohaloarchaeota archaeon]